MLSNVSSKMKRFVMRFVRVFAAVFALLMVYAMTHAPSCMWGASLDAHFLHPTVPPPSLNYDSQHIRNLKLLSRRYSTLSPEPVEQRRSFRGRRFIDVVAEVASTADKQILLALIDGAFLHMAINFYITSIAAHDIQNYLLIATDQTTCDRLMNAGIHCYMFVKDPTAGEASEFNSYAFKQKMNIRTAMILECLTNGYNVLHTDIDMYFSKNPFDYLNCGNCDLVALLDGISYNAGFIYLRSTTPSKNVYKYMQQMVDNNTTLDDQTQLQHAIRHEKYFGPSGIHAEHFNTEQFQCGKVFYEFTQRFFITDQLLLPCDECVVIHNNWIVSMEAKVYRAKELHQWMYDGDHYYSSESRKYLVYDNPLVGPQIRNQELDALKAALAIGEILNRTVVLPRFHCSCSECPLNSLLRIQTFDKHFAGRYREHSFLSNPLVPNSISKSRFGPVLIASNYLEQSAGSELDLVQRVQKLQPLNAKGYSDKDILRLFGDVKQSVLHFFALYNSFGGFVNLEKNEKFETKVKLAMLPDNYRQQMH